MIGEVVAGRYRVVELIGEGATGAVYRAALEPEGDAVAIKILRQGDGTRAKGDEAGLRLEREAVAAGKLAHPNLVAVRDFGALEDGRRFLVMDLLEGKSLAQLLAEERRLPPERALAILAHILRGLGHAHAGGVIHRDLKPADILLVERDGDPDFAIIVDFGTAALLGAAGATAERLTRAGKALGAPAYAAPESVDPDAGPQGGRADLYAATCVLFEMLTGGPPFGAAGAVDAQELLERHAHTPAPALADVVPELESTPGLDAIAARGLAKKPADRFASAEEYLRAVVACQAGTLDPDVLATPAPEAGKLAEPDPSKATTVFHGAPAPIAPVATLSAVGSSAAASEPPAVEQAPIGTTSAPDTAGPTGRRWRFAALGGVVAAAAIVVAVLVLRGGEEGQGGGDDRDPVAGLVEAWRAAGLEPGAFAPMSGEKFEGGDCRAGQVSSIDVIVCMYPTADQARKARRAGLRAMKQGFARTAIPVGKRLLVAARGRGSATAPAMEKLSDVFRRAPAPAGEARGRR